ncbi:MAG: cell envelope integrity protein TolA [Desulfobulbaceae bacterium]|nr:cell envelope integrity protein TolA [Desulfobulbaceae bacterium]
MVGPRFTEKDFFSVQQREDQRWFICLTLAFLFHAGLAGVVLFMPTLFDARMPIEEAVIVSIAPPTPETAPDLGPPSAAPEPASARTEAQRKEATPPEPAPPPQKPEPKPEPVPERTAAQPEPVAPPSPPPPPPKPEPKPEPPPPEPVVAAKEPISLAPVQRKQKLAQDTRLQEERERVRQEEEKKLARELEQRKRQADERELSKKLEEQKRNAERRLQAQREQERREQERQKAIADARRRQAQEDARRAEAEARRAEAEARSAREALASTRAEAGRQTAAIQSATTQAATGRQQGNSGIEQQYWAQVAQRVRSYWVLPEMRRWDTALLARVVITINSDGQVTRIAFDERSNDPLFDQLVEKTIRQASPMPRFPAIMQQGTTQVGFKFRPGELGNL